MGNVILFNEEVSQFSMFKFNIRGFKMAFRSFLVMISASFDQNTKRENTKKFHFSPLKCARNRRDLKDLFHQQICSTQKEILTIQTLLKRSESSEFEFEFFKWFIRKYFK